MNRFASKSLCDLQDEERNEIMQSKIEDGKREWESADIHIKQAVVDEQLLEFEGNLNGNMVRNLKREMKSLREVGWAAR